MPQAFVFGSPIAHSLSPVLHRAAYAALGLSDWSYASREVEQAGFLDVVTGLGPQVRGLSLTMPLKEVAFAIADPVSDRARLAGAINTLVRRGDGWAGDNTDIAGLVASLRPPGAPPELGPGMILGAGATARSALIALHTLGCTCVTVAARDPAKAHASLGELAKTLNLDLTVRPLTDWPASPAALIVSTLPASGALVATTALLASEAALGGIRLLDVVYADWPTPLAQAAAERGASVVSGLDMLIHQAVEQVELMTGRRPDWRTLLAAVTP